MRKKDKPMCCEVTPARMIFPVVPIPANEVFSGVPKDTGSMSLDPLLIRGVSTLPGSVEGAERKAEALLSECRRLVKVRNIPAFLDLLDVNPSLTADYWVRETLYKLAKQRRLHRRRGRPRGDYKKIHPLVAAGLVEQLVVNGDAPNPEQAFGKLEELDVLPHGTARDYYYQVLMEERYKPILLTCPELARQATEEEVAALHHTETPGPGGKIIWTGEDAELGTVEMIIEAKE